MTRAKQGCQAHRLPAERSSSLMGTLCLVHPDKQSRLANRRGMTDTLKTIPRGACFAHPTGFAQPSTTGNALISMKFIRARPAYSMTAVDRA